jgi:hypothetical protein
MRFVAKCLLTALPTQRLATALAENYGLFVWMPEAIHISQTIEQAPNEKWTPHCSANPFL